MSRPPPRAAVNLSIFLLCYNQEVMLPKTWAFYRTQFPEAKFYLMDDGSSDRSVEVARALGMEVIDISKGAKTTATGRRPFPTPKEDLAHNWIWRRIVSPGTWVLTADMDELACVTQEQLEAADSEGATILSSVGYDCVGDSNRSDLSDFNLDTLSRGLHSHMYSKKLLFKAGLGGPLGIDRINYEQGGHSIHPNGTVRYSRRQHPLYHAGELGVAYSIEKFRLYQRRFNATRHKGKSLLYYDHFTTDARRMTRRHAMFLRLANPLTPLGNLSCIRQGNRTADPSLAVGNGPLTPLAQRVRAILGPASPPSVWPTPDFPAPPPQQQRNHPYTGKPLSAAQERQRQKTEKKSLWASLKGSNIA